MKILAILEKCQTQRDETKLPPNCRFQLSRNTIETLSVSIIFSIILLEKVTTCSLELNQMRKGICALDALTLECIGFFIFLSFFLAK